MCRNFFHLFKKCRSLSPNRNPKWRKTSKRINCYIKLYKFLALKNNFQPSSFHVKQIVVIFDGIVVERRNCSFFYSFLFCDYVHSSWSRTDKHEKPKQLDGMQSRLQWNGDDRRKKEGANECKFIAILCTINIYSMMASNWAITNCNLHSLFSLFLLFVFFSFCTTASRTLLSF